ncbi:MAG: NADPH-dependent FMN reductase [Oligoflexus sp.]
MKFALISGSHRKQSESARVTRYIENRVKSLLSIDTYRFELTGNPLPMWDESVWDDGEQWQNTWKPVAKELASSDALIWVVPEWNGMLPSGVVNLLQLCSSKELGHKPALIVAISGSRNGVYPVSQMRLNTSKNNRMLYIPEHIIVREVGKMLQGETASHEDDEYLRGRIDYCLRLLSQYAIAMQQVRGSGVIDYKSYPNGM